jgi:hypothetical protein
MAGDDIAAAPGFSVTPAHALQLDELMTLLGILRLCL